MKRLLAIDDDAQIRRLLQVALSGLGWEVVLAATGSEGLEAARLSEPDLVLLDLNLPDMGGAELLGRLRSSASAPVIILSVRDSERDIVELLEAGADDYVTKPFHADVLAARMEAVLRRRLPGPDPLLRTGALEVDAAKHEARVGGEPVRLTPTEFSLLEALARRAGRIVTRDRLLKELWGPAGEADEGSLRVYVSSLRRKIEADPASPKLIVTVPGVGYRLETISPEEPF